MNISVFLDNLKNIPLNTSRDEFIVSLKNNHSNVFDYLKGETLKSWYPDEGKEVTGLLAEYHDAELVRIIDHRGGCPEGIAVIAVGGYGRGELSPFSDIDILLLHREKAGIEIFARDFLYTLWDMNYHLGSSTRTIRNVLEQAVKDETFLTSVFESRFLCGDRKLFEEMEAAVKRLVTRIRKTYLQNKFEEIYGILEGSGNELLLKEPDLKKSPGGLRSVHLMEWLNFAFNGKKSFEGLKELLPARMFKRLAIAHDFILHIRNVLHFIHNRKEDVLYLDWQLAVANNLGMKGDDQSRMARLMRHYYEKAEQIYLILLFVLDEMNSRMNRKINVSDKKGVPFVLNGRLHVPESMDVGVGRALNLVLEYANGGYRMTYGLVRYLERASFEINDKDRYSGDNFFILRNILETGRAYEALSLMKISGFLYRYFPVFSLIRHKVLYNPFHRFTVDQHSVETIGALEDLVRKELDPVKDKKFIHFQDVAKKYSGNDWVLKLALLLHDIGKALPGDHSKNGVEMATAYLKKQPLYRSYIQAIQFLIKNHLLLSTTVRRSDSSNLEVLTELSREFFFTSFPEDYLDFLYLMTFADISATHPKNFTGYLSDMLTHVYNRVSGLMKIREKGNYGQNLIDEIAAKGVGEEEISRIKDFITTLGESYYLTKSPDEVLDDHLTLKAIEEKGYMVKVHIFNDYIKVKFFIPDRKGLFSYLCGILFLNGSDIAKAGIFTYHNIALDEFTITRVFGQEFSDKSRKEQLSAWKEDLEKLYKTTMDNMIGLDSRICDFKKNVRRLNKLFAIEQEAVFSRSENEPSNGKTAYRLELTCTDRPALLYDISRYLSMNDADIVNAVIDTTGWYVNDVFHLKLQKDTDVEMLKKGLLQIIAEEPC